MKKRYAFVTGGSRGIGRGIAESLLREGFSVAIGGTRPESDIVPVLAELRALGPAHYVRGQISERGQRTSMLEQLKQLFPELHLLVNNAGMAPRERTDLLQASEESFDEVLAVNLKGPYFLTQAVARWMIESGTLNAGIINITSISAYTSSVMRGEYCVSKAGLSMMTKLFADRLAGEGIRVYEIRPGVIKTDMTDKVSAKYDKLIAEGLTPISRWGMPEDIGRAVAAIARGDLPFSTGEVINVDGGFHLDRLN